MTRLLVADDDRFFRQVLTRFLEDAGYEVTAAANGQEAIAQAEAAPVALAVLDVALPLLTGDAVARALPEGTPIVFVSGRDLDRLEGIEGDRYRFLRKPADLDEILDHVRALLGEAP